VPGLAAKQERAKEVQVVTLRVPIEVHEALKTLAFATESSVNEIALRALSTFLAEEGHREAVDGFSKRVREQYRVALDKLADL
jgi:hypothetical protein